MSRMLFFRGMAQYSGSQGQFLEVWLKLDEILAVCHSDDALAESIIRCSGGLWFRLDADSSARLRSVLEALDVEQWCGVDSSDADGASLDDSPDSDGGEYD